MRCWHLIWTKRAAGEILCSLRVPCSFKSSAPDPLAQTQSLARAPSTWGPRWTSTSQLSLRLSHHCPANEALTGQCATTKGTRWAQGVPFSSCQQETFLIELTVMCSDGWHLSISSAKPLHIQTEGDSLSHLKWRFKGHSTNLTH